MINLNDNSFDQKEGKAVFNGGTAGVVENVVMNVVKKTPEDKENAPDYKIVYTDENGGECNSSFWVVKEATSFKSVDELIQAQGKVLKHILHVVYGPEYQIPSFNNATEMLNGCMKLIHSAVNGKNFKVRLFTNYGTTSSPKQYIQPRSWVPFMEFAGSDPAKTRLFAGSLDQMSKISSDTPAAPSAGTIADGDDW